MSNKGLFKYRRVRDRAERGGGHIFEVSQLDQYTAEAGFEDFCPHPYDGILAFDARKK